MSEPNKLATVTELPVKKQMKLETEIKPEYYDEIMSLKNQGKSLQKIVNYLKDQYDCTTSKTAISRLVKRLMLKDPLVAKQVAKSAVRQTVKSDFDALNRCLIDEVEFCKKAKAENDPRTYNSCTDRIIKIMEVKFKFIEKDANPDYAEEVDQIKEAVLNRLKSFMG